MRTPSPDDTFLWRICYALDVPPRMLARDIGIDFAEIAPMLDPNRAMTVIDSDDAWWKIKQYADMRLAELLAIREELNTVMQDARSKQAARISRTKHLQGAPPPVRRIKG